MARFTLRRLSIVAVAGLVFPMGAQAGSAASGFEFYGQFDLGVLSADDGSETNTSVADNDNSNSRIGLIYTHTLSGGGAFRLQFETGLGLTGTSRINGSDNDFELDWRKTDLRIFEAVLETPNAGTISFGQGSTATDGTAQADLSGTTLIIYSSLTDLAADQEFRLADGTASGITVGDAFSNFDGARRFRLRYDTPTYMGFGLALSGGREVLQDGNDNDYYDIGLKYGNDYGDVKVDSRIGYSWRGNSEEQLMGSLAVLHKPSGLNVAFAAGEQTSGGDASYFYAKLGLVRNWLSVGSTAMAVDYYDGRDFEAGGSDSTSVGVGVVQQIERYNLDLFAGYRTYSLDSSAAQFDDMDVTFVGARWTF